MLIGCDRGIEFVAHFCGSDDAGRMARRTLDGNGTGFGSEIFNVLGLDCVSAVVHVGEARFALSGDCCIVVGCALFWLELKQEMFFNYFSFSKQIKYGKTCDACSDDVLSFIV